MWPVDTSEMVDMDMLCKTYLIDYNHLPKGLAKEIVVMEKELRNALPNVFYTCHCWSGLWTLKWFTSQVSQKFTPEYVMGELLNTPSYEQVGIQYLFIFDNTGLKTIIKPVIVLKD